MNTIKRGLWGAWPVLLGVAISSVITPAAVFASNNPGDPVGAGFAVNESDSPPKEAYGNVAMDADGDFVVVWQGFNSNVVAQMYTAAGAPRGSNFIANELVSGGVAEPTAAMNAEGVFVIAWVDYNNNSVRARRYDSAGNPTGGDVVVAEQRGSPAHPAVAVGIDGHFWVAWVEVDAGPGTHAPNGDTVLYFQRFDANGVPVGGNVELDRGGAQNLPFAIAMTPAGNVIFAWELSDNIGNAVYYQQSGADGVPLTGKVQANDHGNLNQLPAVAADAQGNAVVAFLHTCCDGQPAPAPSGVYMQRFDSAGSRIGNNIAVDVIVSELGTFRDASVAMDADGDFVVNWTRIQATEELYGQRYAADGSPVGTKMLLNDNPSAASCSSSNAMDADGDFAVAWNCDDDDFIRARRFAGPEDVDLTLTKTDSADPASSGTPFSYTLAITNNHPAVAPTLVTAIDQAIGSATTIQVTDTLPAGMSFNSASGTDWICADSSGTVTCNYSGVLLAATSVSVQLSVTAPEGVYTNTASLSAAQYDSVAGNNSDSESTTVADATPDPFSFTDQNSVEPGTVITSNTITVSGIMAAASISVSGGQYSVNGGSFISTAGTVNNGDTVQVRHTSAGTSNTATNTTVTIGGVSDTFTSTTAPDTMPDAFTFTDQTGVEPLATVTSTSVTISGIEAAASIGVTGGSYSIGCTGTFTSSAGSINNGQTVCVRHTASGAYSTATDTVLTVGGVSDTFTSTTEAQDTTPSAFSFSDQTGVPVNATITSNAISVSGINSTVAISINGGGGEYSVNSGAFTGAAGTVNPGDSVRVRVTSSSANSTTVTTTLTIGGVSDTFSVTTAAPAPSGGGGGGGLGWVMLMILYSAAALRVRKPPLTP